MPKILIWLIALLGGAQLFALALIIFTTDSESERVIRFEQASRCEEALSLAPLNSTSITSMLVQPAIMPKDCWQPATLPENNKAQNVQVDLNKPQLRRIWYRVHYQVPDNWDATKPLMVYLPRIMANAWQIRINKRSIADNRFDWRSTWNRPVSTTFYSDTFSPIQTLEIDIGVLVSEVEGFSISRISVGDATILSGQKDFREYMQVIMPQAVSAVMFLLGIFFLLFWLVRRAEIEYLILVFISLVFCVNNFIFTLTQPNNPSLETWYGVLIEESPIPWTVFLIYLFIARFAKFSFPWLERLLSVQVIIVSLFTLSPLSSLYDFSMVKSIFSMLLAILVDGVFIWQAIVKRNIALFVISVTMIIGFYPGFHDIGLSLNYINPEDYFLGPYFGLALFTAFFYAIQRRYVAAIKGQEQLNISLAKQLVEREALTQQLTNSEAELRANQSRLLELERAQTLTAERHRLMHDMHDGLGSSLLTTLAAIEKTNMPQQAVADALRVCIDDLRLVIDSLEPTANDLVTLLGTIRYRLGQRLVKAGLELKWEINDLPTLPWLEPPDALNVLRLVQEALVNILKHANAKSIHVKTSNLGGSVEILIEDDGYGYDPNTTLVGRGIPSQNKRAERLGGELLITSLLGHGTSLRLRLPINKDPKS